MRIGNSVTGCLENVRSDCMFVRLCANNHACLFVIATFMCNAQRSATDGNEGPVKMKSKNIEAYAFNVVMQILELHVWPLSCTLFLAFALLV